MRLQDIRIVQVNYQLLSLLHKLEAQLTVLQDNPAPRF